VSSPAGTRRYLLSSLGPSSKTERHRSIVVVGVNEGDYNRDFVPYLLGLNSNILKDIAVIELGCVEEEQVLLFVFQPGVELVSDACATVNEIFEGCAKHRAIQVDLDAVVWYDGIKGVPRSAIPILQIPAEIHRNNGRNLQREWCWRQGRQGRQSQSADAGSGAGQE